MNGSKRLGAIFALGAGALLFSQAIWADWSDGDWVWHVNGGYGETIGKTKDYLNGSWTFGGGFAFQPDDWENLALQLDLGYADMSATNNLILLGQQHSPVRINSGDGSLGWLTIAGKFHMDFTDVLRGYGLLGIGGYHRYVELSQTALFAGAVCDPWWGYCYPGVVSGQAVVASRSQFRFGYNVGLGLEWQTSGAGVWFIEARYHRTAGSNPTEIIPIQIGVRF